MSNLWGPISADDWSSTPVTQGRCATVEDVKEGRAVFQIEGDAQSVDIELPQMASQTLEDSQTIPVIVI